MIAHPFWSAIMHFLLLDMYSDADTASDPEAWRRHCLNSLNQTETALTIGVSPSTLRRWRKQRIGPRPTRRKGKIAYTLGSLFSFLEAEAKIVGYKPELTPIVPPDKPYEHRRILSPEFGGAGDTRHRHVARRTKRLSQ